MVHRRCVGVRRSVTSRLCSHRAGAAAFVVLFFLFFFSFLSFVLRFSWLMCARSSVLKSFWNFTCSDDDTTVDDLALRLRFLDAETEARSRHTAPPAFSASAAAFDSFCAFAPPLGIGCSDDLFMTSETEPLCVVASNMRVRSVRNDPWDDMDDDDSGAAIERGEREKRGGEEWGRKDNELELVRGSQDTPNPELRLP